MTLLFTFLLLPAWLQPCAGIEILNEFEEGGCDEIALWKKSPPDLQFSALPSAQGGNYLAKNQNWYGWVTWTGSGDELRLEAANFRDQWGGNLLIPEGNATQGRDALRIDYATTLPDAERAGLRTVMVIADESGRVFHFRGPLTATKASVTHTHDWIHLLFSLNYASNLGLDLTHVAWVALKPEVGGTGSYSIAYDHFSLDNDFECPGIYCPPFPDNKPNSPVAPGSVRGSPDGCNRLQLSWAESVKDGTDDITGYHVFRSSSSNGPWTPVAYVPSNHCLDSGAGAINYYKILPYAIRANFYGVEYLRASEDPLALGSGVHEAKLLFASAAGPFAPGCVSTIVPVTPSPIATASPRPVVTPTPAPVQLKAAIVAGPNPFDPSRGQRLSFKGAPADSTVRIFDLSGHLVYVQTLSPGNPGAWDGTTQDGGKAAPGIYLALVSGSSKLIKICLVR